jgi:hypothetical protein
MANLSQPARTRNHITGFRVRQQQVLQCPKSFVVEIISPLPGECWQLDEQGIHAHYYTQVAYALESGISPGKCGWQAQQHAGTPVLSDRFDEIKIELSQMVEPMALTARLACQITFATPAAIFEKQLAFRPK